MKLTYAQFIKMMGVINEMIQVKPGPLVSVTSVLGMNANRIENVLKGYKISRNAIQSELKAKVMCVQVNIAECGNKGPVVALLAALQDNPEQWSALIAADEQLITANPLWFQRGDLRFSEEALEEIWTADTTSILGPYEIDNIRYFAIRLLKRQEQDLVPTEQKEIFDTRVEELDETPVEVKVGKIKVAALVRSEEMRPGYETDATWFYRAPEMFVFLEEEPDEEPED